GVKRTTMVLLFNAASIAFFCASARSRLSLGPTITLKAGFGVFTAWVYALKPFCCSSAFTLSALAWLEKAPTCTTHATGSPCVSSAKASGAGRGSVGFTTVVVSGFGCICGLATVLGFSTRAGAGSRTLAWVVGRGVTVWATGAGGCSIGATASRGAGSGTVKG